MKYFMRTDLVFPCSDLDNLSMHVRVGDGEWQHIIFGYGTTTAAQIAAYIDDQTEGIEADYYSNNGHVYIISYEPIIVDSLESGLTWIECKPPIRKEGGE